LLRVLIDISLKSPRSMTFYLDHQLIDIAAPPAGFLPATMTFTRSGHVSIDGLSDVAGKVARQLRALLAKQAQWHLVELLMAVHGEKNLLPIFVQMLVLVCDRIEKDVDNSSVKPVKPPRGHWVLRHALRTGRFTKRVTAKMKAAKLPCETVDRQLLQYFYAARRSDT
jgi:hypothetical protein